MMNPSDLIALRKRYADLILSANRYQESADHSDTQTGRARDLQYAREARTAAALAWAEYEAAFTGQPAPRCPECCELLDMAAPANQGMFFLNMGRNGLLVIDGQPCGHSYLAKPTITVTWGTQGVDDGR
jgi:hypothetical protein